jgi:hypothetical protein
MCDFEFSFLDVDDLAMLANDLLDQFRDRGMNDTIPRKVLNNTYKEKIWRSSETWLRNSKQPLKPMTPRRRLPMRPFQRMSR